MLEGSVIRGPSGLHGSPERPSPDGQESAMKDFVDYRTLWTGALRGI